MKQHMRQNLSPTRRGVTLTEVLMSMLIMSIGVVSVAAMFPLSVLRSIQATQLTNATNLRYNAESMADAIPSLIHNPDAPDNPKSPDTVNFREHFRTVQSSRYIVDPLGFWTSRIDNPDTRLFTTFGNTVSGGSTVYIGPLRRYHGGTNLQLTREFNANAVGPSTNTLGEVLQRLEDDRNDQPLLANPLPVATLDALRLNARHAATFVTVPDSWSIHVDEVPERIGKAGDAYVTQVTMPGTVDLTTLPVRNQNAQTFDADPDAARITLFSIDGRASYTYPITYVDTDDQVVMWTEDTDGDLSYSTNEDLNRNNTLDLRRLPPGFSVGNVRIETSNNQSYSWLLTVRKNGEGDAQVDVVVIFGRSFDPVDERVHPARFRRVRLDAGGSPIGTSNNRVAVDVTAYEDEPFLKKGGYMFDAVNARWYRIQDIQDVDSAAAQNADNFPSTSLLPTSTNYTRDYVDVVLDEDVKRNADFGAILMPGVVKVFHLGTKSLPTSFE